MADTKKLLFGLFRTKSRAGQQAQYSQGVKADIRRGDQQRHNSTRSRSSLTIGHRTEENERAFLAPTSVDGLENQEVHPLGRSMPEWPPPGLTSEDELSEQDARNCVTLGVPIYCGFRVPVPHASQDYFALYATCEGVNSGSDGARFYKPAFSAMTLHAYGPGLASRPWETLEQPSLAFCYGEMPGTITLNHWISISSRFKPIVALRDPGTRPRELPFIAIVSRLIYLETRFEEDEDLMYKNLYKVLLRDPERFLNPHKAMEKQIADLIIILSGPQWIDFSDPRNHVVAKFFKGANYADEDRYKKFFHQLLLSMELEIRINSKHHAEKPKQKLLSQLPPCIAWNLALARRWRECINIKTSATQTGSEKIKFHLRVRKRQVKALRKFARAMKWPNFPKVDEFIRSKDNNTERLENRTSDASSYFSGVVLPGPSLPFILINTLIDCDMDSDLGALSHIYPNCGFQYRNATYWSSTCIIGKVLGPQSREIAGWIGPAMSTSDLERVQIVSIRQRRQRQQVSSNNARSMKARSDPLGPPPLNPSYPIKEYQLVSPDLEEIPNTIRIEKLSLKPALGGVAREVETLDRLRLHDACIQFAINGSSWPLRLSFDVSYIYAYPCAGGPHPLFYDYIYKAVKVDEILSIKDWGGLFNMSNLSPGVENSTDQIFNARRDNNDAEMVLVIEAFGVSDNEVLARAWASHWGLSAVVANVHRTCMACAIREAFAACLNVIILVSGL